MMNSMWKCVEGMLDLGAVSAQWKQMLGAEFEAWRSALLQKSDQVAMSVPCPACGDGSLEVMRYGGGICGVPRCDLADCEEVPLTEADLVVWDWSWNKAGRALAKAFGCDAKVMDMGMTNTWQIAALGGHRLPVVVTIQLEREGFRAVVSELVARMRTGFVLLAPTGKHHDARIQELLTHAKAGFFDLASHVSLLPNGVLQASKSGGELFSRYLPEEDEPISENEAARVFALMKKLDTTDLRRKAPTSMVFRLYCQEGLSRAEVAKRCGCVEALITLRLKELEAKLGRKPTELRQLSGHFQRMEDSLTDARARHIRRETASDDDRFGDRDEY